MKEFLFSLVVLVLSEFIPGLSIPTEFKSLWAEMVATPQPELAVTSQEATTEAVLGEQSSFLVTRVIDGDTIELETGQKVRYIGIDTPETKDPRSAVECFGQEAAQRNAELVADKYVQLEKDISETDRYGRLLRYVFVDGKLVNQLLVEEGYAVASSYPPDVAKQEVFREAEAQARLHLKGLWGSCQ